MFSFKRLFLCLIVAISFAGNAQDLITNIPNRKTTSLNGDWNYIVDPYNTGYSSFHGVVYDQQKGFSNSAFFNNYHAKDKKELVEYDFDKSPTMKIPSDWNTQDEKLYYYEGVVWFKKSFDYDLQEDTSLFVYFEAVNYKAEVYFNGHKLGVHKGGFTPFNFEITPYLKEKDNFLIVKVDNIRSQDEVPTINTDWWNYGGITRDVRLVETRKSYIRDYTFRVDKTNNKLIEGEVFLNDASINDRSVLLKIPELKIEKQIAVHEGKGSFSIPAKKLQLWDPTQPKLYDVTLDFNGAILTDRIGFRTVKTSGPDILINGKPVFLKGISIHEESSRGGRGYSLEDAQRLLGWAKELGCNYVRLAHYPHNENMVRLADEMGILVWEEIPVYWTISFDNQETYQNAANQLNEVITRDKNRASVIIWSVANETPVSEARNTFLGNLVNRVRTLDNTRLVSAALLSHNHNIDDEIGKDLDIVAFNQYLGWYGGKLEDADTILWKTPYNKPVVVSEFGGGAKAGLHGSKDERWTEEYQEYLYQQNLKMISKIPNIRGLSPWILVDFRSPRRLLPEIQDDYNRKGLISETGEKKKAFFVMQEFYKNLQGTEAKN